MDCPSVRLHYNTSRCCSLSRLLPAQLERHDHRLVEDRQVMSESGEDTSLVLHSTVNDHSRPRSSYHANRFEKYEFPDLNMLNVDGPERGAEEKQGVYDEIQKAEKSSVTQSRWAAKEALITEFSDSHSTRFLAIPSWVDPLVIRLAFSVKPLRI